MPKRSPLPIAIVGTLLLSAAPAFAAPGVEKERPKQAEGSCPPPEQAVRTPVELTLKWFAAHQLPSGAWSYDHGKAPAHRGPVDHTGLHRSQTGATGLVLLCHLGAGGTHLDGEHRETVAAGLRFLQESIGGAAQSHLPQSRLLRVGRKSLKNPPLKADKSPVASSIGAPVSCGGRDRAATVDRP